MSFGRCARFEMNPRLYGRFASSLHGEAQLNGCNNVIIGETKPGNIEPVQKIDMDGRALYLSSRAQHFQIVIFRF